ncbi:MAG TPA: F0F1 ATP synthase subunit B [Bacillota bacterium]|jgi:F-type H+-transporting ATPase subunit b|nr:F0F1 ATP synthase subunit B [Bacillota bacterium]
MIEALHMSLLEVIFAIVNFLILVGVLAKFLYRPFLAMLEERNQSIRGAFENAEATNRRADEKLEAYNKRIASVEEEGREILRNARQRAETQAKEIVDEASERANQMVVQAQKEIERQQAKALTELKGQVAALALLAAEKVLEKELSGEGHGQLVESILEQAGESGWQN